MNLVVVDAFFGLGSVENFISEEFLMKNYFSFRNLRIEKDKILIGIGQEELRLSKISFIF